MDPMATEFDATLFSASHKAGFTNGKLGKQKISAPIGTNKVGRGKEVSYGCVASTSHFVIILQVPRRTILSPI